MSSSLPRPMDELQTEFLVPELHCPSCISYIEELLAGLHPNPSSIACSLISHTLTLCHSPELDLKHASDILTDAGYPPYSVVQNDKVILSRKERNLFFQDLVHWFRGQVRRSRASRSSLNHVKHCDLCQNQGLRTAQLSSGTLENAKGADSEALPPTVELKSVITEPVQQLQWQAVLSISGMTCASCVNTISESLQGKPWVRKAAVNLLTNSAAVEFEGSSDANELVRAVEELGYDAVLESVQPLSHTQHAGEHGQIWQGSFSVQGMSCSSCVGKITGALEQKPWIRDVSVNFLATNAVVQFEGRQRVSEVKAVIESIGYRATLVDLIQLDMPTVKSMERTVSLFVQGIFCEHCPSRIHAALAALDHPVAFQNLPSTKDPVFTVTYTPKPPEFTIRHILAALSAAHGAFKPSIYHPPTIEDRAHAMRVRERCHTLYRLALSVIAAVPSFIIGIVFMSLVSKDNTSRMYLMEPWANVSRAQWALFVIATPVYFFAADMFHRRALRGLYALWRPGSSTSLLRRIYRFGSMDLLISLGTSIAYFSSVVEIVIASRSASDMATESRSSYFDSVVFLTMFLLIGRLIEAWSKAKTGDAVASLRQLRAPQAILCDSLSLEGTAGNVLRKVEADALEVGDVISIPNGASPPCDGILLDGVGQFDESSLTGESRLVLKTAGDDVLSGTVNKGGPVVVRATKLVGSSMLDQIIAVVREGQAKRAPIERVADSITAYFVPIVTLIAVATWIIWLALGMSGSLPADWLDGETGGWPYWALQFSIAVFIIACPCGIGLAAPTALFVGGGIAAKHGILVKGGGEAFQEASGLDVVVFDKTGTLSEGGDPSVSDHQYLSSSDRDQPDLSFVRSATKALEENSNHPLASAIVKFLNDQEERTDVRQISTNELLGRGMEGEYMSGTYAEKTFGVLVGNERLMHEQAVDFDKDALQMLDSWKRKGNSVVLVAIRTTDLAFSMAGKWKLRLMFSISDRIRPESAGVVKALQNGGIDVWMISGDNETTAEVVGQAVGIPPDKIIAGVLPEQKAEKIRYLQRSQKKASRHFLSFSGTRANNKERATVAMVGDGVNDSPALTAADVGIAIGSGSDVAISSAAFVLVTCNLSSILVLLQLSHKVFTRIKFNFGWALVYNLVALPVAAGVFYPLRSNGEHVRLDPVWASLAMALSSISVVTSSLLLKTRLPYVGFRQNPFCWD